MDREPLLCDLDPVDEARGNHPPADKALKPAKREQTDKLELQIPRQRAAQPEENKRQRDRKADDPAEQPMAPFPEENELEAI